MRAAPFPDSPASADSLLSGLSLLFDGISDEQYRCVRACLGVQSFTFEKEEEILACAGERSTYGVLVTGAAFDVRRHPQGERTLIDVIEPGDLFGEGWRAGTWGSGERPRERAAIGASRGSVLLLDPARLSDPTVMCPAKSLLQGNLLRSVLDKQERLRTKLEILRHRSLRKRIANYLVVEAQRRGVTQFSIPMSRIELAQYLHADRAALSRELARMKADGIIDYHRNSFALRAPSEAALSLG